MKLSTTQKAGLVILLVLLFDQTLKIWVKSNMALGESIAIFSDWGFIHYTENPGMAFGLKWGGIYGKLALSIFRIIAVIGLVVYLKKLIVRKAPLGFIIGVSLILAGAAGNILDSMFYGLFFDTGMVFNAETGYYNEYQGISEFSSNGYAPFLLGNVVDMLYFPFMEGSRFPDWVPYFGGREFRFFQHIFNLADAAITTGIIWLIIKQKSYFGKKKKEETIVNTEPA